MLLSIIRAWLYGLLSIMPPYFGFLFTNHLITEYDRDRRAGIALMGACLIGMAVYLNSLIYIMIFLAIYAIIIGGYMLLRKVEGIGEFDKGAIISIVSIVIIAIIYYTNYEMITSTLEETKTVVMEILNKMYEGQAVLVEEAIDKTFNGIINMLFTYILITYLITAFMQDKEKTKDWSISYIHLLWYIGAYALIFAFNLGENVIIENILKACQNLFVIYGFKAAYKSVTKKEGDKAKLLGVLFASLLYLLSPVILFIYGSISSFDLFKKEH